MEVDRKFQQQKSFKKLVKSQEQSRAGLMQLLWWYDLTYAFFFYSSNITSTKDLRLWNNRATNTFSQKQNNDAKPKMDGSQFIKMAKKGRIMFH